MMDHPKRNPGRALTSLLFLITATLLISSGQHVPAVAGDDPELTRLYGGTPVRELDGPEPFRSGDAFDVELVDHVDCTRETHDFRSDGKTELIELKPGRTFRVTGPPKQKHYNVLRKAKGRSDKPEDISEFVTPWFSYKLDLDGDGQYMIVMETINDRPRHTSLITYVRSREIWFGNVYGRACPFGFYSGYDVPVTNRVFKMGGLFVPPPEANSVRVCITSPGDLNAKNPEASRREGKGGAAVSDIWMYRIKSSFAEQPNPIEYPPGPNRKIGPLIGHENIWHRQFGGVGANELSGDEKRARYRTAAERFANYMTYTGMNELKLVVTGDETSTGQEHFDDPDPNQFVAHRLFANTLAEHGVDFLPFVSLIGGTLDELKKIPSLREETRTMHVSGQRDVGVGASPNPARPEYRQFVRRFMTEVGEFYRSHENVDRIGMKGIFYRGGGWGDDRSLGPSYWGYSDWTLNKFAGETNVELPSFDDTKEAREYLKKNMWAKWLRWRASQSEQLHISVRDVIKNVDPRYKLVLSLHGTLAELSPEKTWNYMVDELPPGRILRRGGLEPGSYNRYRDLFLQQKYLVGRERAMARAHPHAHGIREWNYDARITNKTYRTAEGNAAMIAYKWEVPNHPRVMDFRASVGPIMSGPERHYLYPLLHALRTKNPQFMHFYAFQLATRGRTHMIREFVRGYLALPRKPFRTIQGERSTKQTSGWIATCGRRIIAINDTPEAREVQVPASVFDEGGYREVVTGSFFMTGGEKAITLSLRPCDLRVLVPEASAPGRK